MNPAPLDPPLHPLQALLARETRRRAGAVPGETDGVAVPPGQSRLVGDRFVLRTDSGFGFAYRRGEGVTVSRPPHGDAGEEELWANGTVYAAVASIAGLVPIHASAVVHDGRAWAFTGPSGAGKSTLAAALGRHGLPLLCDDTMVLDLAGAGPLLALPGHKRLKLVPDALALTGAAGGERVAADVDKVFAAPPAGSWATPVPLAALFVLGRREPCGFAPLRAGERIAVLEDDHYTATLFARARGLDAAGRFALLGQIAARLPMERFDRPAEPARFDEGVAAAARRILHPEAP